MTDKIIQWIFMQFKFNILLVTLTQKVITHWVLKISHMDGREFVWARESFFKDDKWEIKLLSEYLCNSHLTFYDSNSENNNS